MDWELRIDSHVLAALFAPNAMVDNYFHFAIVLLLLQVLLTRPRRSPRHRMPIGSETRTCSETDCGRPHYARGLCNNCYRKVQRRGGFDKHSRELNTITGILDEVTNGSGWCAVVHLLLSPVLGGGWSCSEAIVLVRLGGGVNVLIGRWALSCTFSVIVTPSWSRRWNCRVPAH